MCARSRLWSFFKGYWFQQKGHLLGASERAFELWVQLILHRNASTSSLFEASDLDHVRPALLREETEPLATSDK